MSIKDRKKNLDTTGDPWNGRTLEWSTPSPAPYYNFAVLPQVTSIDAFWEAKQAKKKSVPQKFKAFWLPKNTPIGMYIGILAFLFGFAAIWHLAWLAVLAVVGVIAMLVIRALDEKPEYLVPAAEVERQEALRTKKVAI